MQFKRQNVIWVTMLLILSVFAMLAGAPPLVAATLFGMTGVAGVLTMMPNAQSVAQTLQTTASTARTSRSVSSRARDAVNRAENRGGRLSSDMTLLDVGLIATTMTENGLEMRRDDQVSKDDQGTRPFIVLKVEAPEADRTARLRFEILDPSGAEQYVHEMDVYLREGEMNILPDTHLPLEGNTRLTSMGECTVRVSLDGDLMALDSFSLVPAYEERRSRLGGATRRTYAMSDADARRPSAVSLEDLLREQNDQRRSQRQ